MNLARADAMALGRLDAHEQAALLQTGQISAPELVEAAIIRIDHLDRQVDAMTWRAFDEARQLAGRWSRDEARPMAGVPYLLKDSLDYPGMPSLCGSRARLGAAPPTQAFPYVRRLDAAGLIPLGKTSVPEFALLPTTEPVFAAPTRNPWSRNHSPGGSSGGAAVAVATGMVPYAHAADGGGSIRIPASCCGVVGLKPGRGGNVRARGPHIIEDLLVGDTLLGRSIRDVAWATRATLPEGAIWHQPPRRPLRIALIQNGLNDCAPHNDVSRAVEATATVCAALGHTVEQVSLPLDGPALAAAFQALWIHLGREAHDSVAQGELLLEGWTRGLARRGRSLPLLAAENIVVQSALAAHALTAFFEQWDVILSPVLSDPPVAIGTLGPERDFAALFDAMFDYVSYTPLHNLVGLPSISLPLGFSGEGLPIGSLLSAGRGQEPMLLALAAELEMAVPWADRWPPVSCVFADQGVS